MPAFDHTENGAPTARRSSQLSRYSRKSPSGPIPQFAPTTSAPHWARVANAVSMPVPLTVFPFCPKLMLQITGSAVASFAAISARRASLMSVIVSTVRMSTPPAARLFACEKYASYARSEASGPTGSMSRPVGPSVPATITLLPRAASRAIPAARRLISALCPSSP